MNILQHESIRSEWLSGHDLAGQPTTVTIASVEEVTVQDTRTGQPKRMVAVRFNGRRQRLLLNRTNASALAALLGNETDKWQGRSVQLRPEKLRAFGAEHCVVRVAGIAPAPEAPPPDLPPEVAAWQTPDDAYAWAVSIGASENVVAARNAMKSIVDAHGGRFTKDNAQAIYTAYYHERMARAQEKAKAALETLSMETVPEVDPEGVFN